MCGELYSIFYQGVTDTEELVNILWCETICSMKMTAVPCVGLPWWWRRYVHWKRRSASTRLHLRRQELLNATNIIPNNIIFGAKLFLLCTFQVQNAHKTEICEVFQDKKQSPINTLQTSFPPVARLTPQFKYKLRPLYPQIIDNHMPHVTP
jgi:hypothetical protein